LRDELDQFKKNYPDRFKLHYTVDIKPEQPWEYGVGFVTQQMLQDTMPPPGEDSMVLYCGPPPFEDMMKKHLTELKYTDNMIFKF
jgi:hypothetical protein